MPKTAPPFVRFMTSYGRRKFAAALGVTVWTVDGWRKHALGMKGGFRPDPARMDRILRVANGALTPADIYPKRKKALDMPKGSL